MAWTSRRSNVRSTAPCPSRQPQKPRTNFAHREFSGEASASLFVFGVFLQPSSEPGHAGYNRRVRRALAALLLAGGGVFVLADTVSDATRAELARERRRLSSDVRSLADVSRRVETSLSQLAAAARAVSDS